MDPVFGGIFGGTAVQYCNLPLKNTTFQLFGGNMGYMSVKY